MLYIGFLSDSTLSIESDDVHLALHQPNKSLSADIGGRVV